MTSWIQNSLMLIGFGLGFDRIVLAWTQAFPDKTPAAYGRFAAAIALTAIGFGILLLALAIVEHVGRLRALEGTGRLPERLFSALATAGVIIFGLLAVAAVFVKAL